MILRRFRAKARPDEARVIDRADLRFFARYLRGRAGLTAVCLVAAIGQSFLPLPMIPLVRLAFDRAIPRGDTGQLLVIGLGVAAIRVLGAGVAIFTRAQVVALKTGVILDLRRDLLGRLYDRPHVSHVRAENQPLFTHIVVDADRVDIMLDQTIGTALPSALTCVALGAAMIYLNVTLTALGVVLLPLVWAVVWLTSRRIRANYRRYHDAHDAFIRGVRFVLDNFALTRARGAEPTELARQSDTLETLRKAAVHGGIDNVRNVQVQSLVLAAVGVLILVVGGEAVARHAMTMGGLLAFFVAAGLAGNQLDRVIGALPPLIEGTAALSRLHAHMNAAPPPPYNGRGTLDWTGAVALEHVGFSYGSGRVLKDVSFCLEPGASVGIVGANGAGKTTILSLILGLYRPQAGRLTADGVAYDDLDMPALRRRIGLVEQHPVFFNGSVFDNIAYGAPGATRSLVEAIADQLGAGGVLGSLPGGLDAPLGETGLMLSGGQRQIIAILRALVTAPRLLVLDEPTNHLDRRTVARLVSSLRSMSDRPAMLMISHDPAAVAGLDTLYRLELGALAPAETVAVVVTSGLAEA